MFAKCFFIKYKYKDEDKVREMYVHADTKELAKNRLQRMHNFKIEILDCYQFN